MIPNVRYSAAGILSHICSDGEHGWDISDPSFTKAAEVTRWEFYRLFEQSYSNWHYLIRLTTLTLYLGYRSRSEHMEPRQWAYHQLQVIPPYTALNRGTHWTKYVMKISMFSVQKHYIYYISGLTASAAFLSSLWERLPSHPYPAMKISIYSIVPNVVTTHHLFRWIVCMSASIGHCGH